MTEELPLLLRRRIEALFAREIFASLREEIGEERARAVLARAVQRMAEEMGRALAQTAPEGASLEHFRSLQPLWRAGGALEVIEEDAPSGAYHFRVTRCRYAEMYRELGMAELGAILSCGRDGALSGGYDARLTLERPQTLMEGASCCLFRYRWAETPPRTSSAPRISPEDPPSPLSEE
jgi:hypothetical protein